MDDPLKQAQTRHRGEWLVDEEAAGVRLDRYLGHALYPSYSRSYLAGLIREGRVLVNQAAVRPSYRIEVGDEVVADLGPPADESPRPQELPLEVLYEDDHVVAVNKPAGLLVHPGPSTKAGTLVNALLHHYPEIHKVGVVHRPGIVHRLDRDTSGIMLVARTNAARKGLADQFKERTVKKEYRALVCGKVTLQSDYIDFPIGNDPRQHDRMRVDLTEGKPSSTFYEVLERLPGFSFLRVAPLTGRTHQIRLHMSQLGHPVILDRLYGRGRGQAYQRFVDQRRTAELALPRIRRQALHAFQIEVVHPVDGRRLQLQSPLPADMVDLIDLLRETRLR